MNHHRTASIHALAIVWIVIAAFTSATPVFGEGAPQIDAVRAARIATDYLATHGAGAPFIVSLTLEKSALLHGKSSWVARWSRAVSADGDQEVGLRVNLDGTTARLVVEKELARKRHFGAAGVR